MPQGKKQQQTLFTLWTGGKSKKTGSEEKGHDDAETADKSDKLISEDNSGERAHGDSQSLQDNLTDCESETSERADGGNTDLSMMLQQLLIQLRPQARTVTCLLRRNISATSAIYAKGQDLHPIQKLFVDKIREYAKKSQAAGGGMVDADPQIKKEMDNEASRLNKMYGGGDLSQFPDVQFKDIDFTEAKK